MKKLTLFFVIITFFFVFFSFGAFSVNDSEDIQNRTEEELFSLFDQGTAEALEKIGIDSLDYSKIYNVSFSNLLSYFKTDLSEKFNEALKFFMLLLGITMIISAVKAFAGAGEENSALRLVSLMTVIMLTVGKLTPVINTVLSVIDLSGRFMLGFIPVFAGIVAFGGNPASALTYNTLTLAFAEGISVFSNNVAVPAIGAFYCLSISFSLNKSMNLSRLVSAFSKVSSVVMGLLASLFTALISIKGVMSASVDSVSAKGIRFIISSMIPVVGGAISEAYSAVVGSIGLIKGSVAVVGIVASLIINIPALFETLIYYICLSLVSFFGEAAGLSEESALLRAFSTGIKFLLLLLIYEMFILIISTGLMITIRTAS